jgi:hypothetical protein
MKADVDGSMLRKRSLLFWCTLVVPVAIIAIGGREPRGLGRTLQVWRVSEILPNAR